MLEILKKHGIEDTKANEVLNDMKEAGIHTTSLENVDVRYNKQKEKIKQLEEQIKIKDETIKSFDGALTKEEIENLKKDYETKLEAQEVNFKQTQATERLFSEYKFSSENARIGALLQFKEAGLKFEGDNWVGGKEFLEEMKKNDPNSFQSEKSQTPPSTGFNPTGTNGGEVGITKEKFKTMNMAQRIKLRNDDPKLYEELSQ